MTTQKPFSQRVYWCRLFFSLQINQLFSPRHSMIPAQCAEKASMALTTAFCPHQNPQKRAPSGQSDRRGRRSEKRAKQLYLLHCSRDAILTSPPHNCHHRYEALLNKLHYMHHCHNIQLQLYLDSCILLRTFMLCTPIFSPSFTTHKKGPRGLLKRCGVLLTALPSEVDFWMTDFDAMN